MARRYHNELLGRDLERFSGLSSEMVSLLENLTQDINRSAQELRDIRAAVDAGKKELAALRESEREASVLKPQLEDLRMQKEGLENLIADRRNAWEEGKNKARLGRKGTRGESQNPATEGRGRVWRMRENEQMQARQKFEEELEAMRQKSAEIADGRGNGYSRKGVDAQKKGTGVKPAHAGTGKVFLRACRPERDCSSGSGRIGSRFEIRDSRFEIADLLILARICVIINQHILLVWASAPTSYFNLESRNLESRICCLCLDRL